MARLTKSIPVFDCDAHINDPEQIWGYVPESKKELVRNTYWRDDNEAWLNGDTPVMGGGNGHFAPSYNPICIAGPQMNKKIMRKLRSMVPLTDEQRAYVHHDGAIDPHARITEMDLMGIDQVLVIPTMVIMHLPFATDAEGVDVFCQAYNDFLVDWCGEVPDRLYGAALLPVQDPVRTAKEIHRAKALGHPVGLIRPIDAQAKYPNEVRQAMMAGGGDYDEVFRAFEETGMVLGMHTFPAPSMPHPLGAGYLTSPGELFTRAGTDSQTFSFIHEMQVWLSQVLLSGFLDRYDRLHMAVFESNAEWLPYTLETCDRLYKLYASKRDVAGDRLPSQAFAEQCVISFESDEVGVFEQWGDFENVGIWASDAYHHDGADVWSAMRNMTEAGVPEAVQAKLLGANVCRWYGIEPKMFVTDEAGPIERPDWFPGGPELAEWADIVAHPRENADQLAAMGLDPVGGRSIVGASTRRNGVVLMAEVAEVIDSDSHVYEPAAVWDDFVPSEQRATATRAFHHVIDDDGNETIVLNGQPGTSLHRAKLVRQAIWRPGMTLEDIGGLDPHAFHRLNPGASEAAARLEDMDAMGVDQAIVYPTLFNEYLPQVRDREAAAILARAYNDWVWELAARGAGRLHPVAILPLQTDDLARAELERVAAKGFTAVLFRPAFYDVDAAAESFGRQLTAARAVQGTRSEPVAMAFVEDRPFRALWQRVDELGLVACVHPSLGITGNDLVSSGGFADRVSQRLAGIRHTIAEPIAYMQDADLFVTAALFHGLLEDLPYLRIAIAHSGATWVPLALEKSETYLWLGGMGSVPVCLEPEEVWDRHPIAVSFDSWEKPVARRPGTLGRKAAWGSRYPQHDAAGPADARWMLEDHGVEASSIDELLGGHCAELFGLAVGATI